jgi:hypothetical protein
MLYLMKKYRITILIISLISIIFFSCNEEDAPLPAQEDHFEAEGIVFMESGIIIAEIFRGVTDDTLFAPKGGLSSHTNIKFYDANKQIINPPDVSKQTLAWEFVNNTIASVWQHPGEEGSFEFHLKGLAVGATQMEFFVMHEGHADFRSGKITVVVKDDSATHGEPVGLKLYDEESDSLLATVEQNGTVIGSINLAGSTDTTDHMIIKFFDDNDAEFQPDATEHSITITSLNTTIAGITGLEPDEPYAFKVFGKASGNTTLKIDLLHLGSVEFTAPNIPVIVP